MKTFPRCVVQQMFVWAAATLFGSAFSLSSAHGQLLARPPLTSGGASVMMVATLETVGVGAQPAAALSTSPTNDFSTGSTPLAITTRWVVPSHLTTLRLASYVEKASLPVLSPAGMQAAAVRGQVSTGIPTIPTSLTEAGPDPDQVGLTLLTQAAQSSMPGSRTDNLNLEFGGGGMQAGPGVVSIVLQAL
jgi:hypothetical protein